MFIIFIILKYQKKLQKVVATKIAFIIHFYLCPCQLFSCLSFLRTQENQKFRNLAGNKRQMQVLAERTTFKQIKSPLNYIGGKYKLLEQILPLLPKETNTFVDLFVGGCIIY